MRAIIGNTKNRVGRRENLAQRNETDKPVLIFDDCPMLNTIRVHLSAGRVEILSRRDCVQIGRHNAVNTHHRCLPYL